MEIKVTAFEAESRMRFLLDRVAEGHSVTILRQGVAVARLVPAMAAAQPAPPLAAE